MSRIRVLIADDHDSVVLLLMRLLRLEFDVVGAVRDGQELVAAAKALNPDVIVTDISMPQMDGIEATRLIIEDNPDAKIILLTLHNAPIFVKSGLEAGALGYVLKTQIDEQLTQAIHQAHEGKRFVSPEITGVDL